MGAQAGGLGLEIAPEPAVARVGQPVSVRVVWRNAGRSGTVLKVNRRGLLGRDVRIDVRSNAGRVVLWAPKDRGEPTASDYQTLAPGESFEYEYPVKTASGEPLPAGVYDVRVEYRGGSGEPGAWAGTLAARTKVRVRTDLVR